MQLRSKKRAREDDGHGKGEGEEDSSGSASSNNNNTSSLLTPRTRRKRRRLNSNNNNNNNNNNYEEEDKKDDTQQISLNSIVKSNIDNVMTKYHDQWSSWDFNVFEFMNDPLVNGRGLAIIGYYICIHNNQIIETCQINSMKFYEFLLQIEKRYLNNPYHNAIHAVDVMLNVFCFMTSQFMKCHMNKWDELSLYVSALVHDVGHDGYNNEFHVNTQSNLALLYNNTSVLENYHLHETFHVLHNNNCNWMNDLPKPIRKYIGECIKYAVLKTDMSFHAKTCSNLQQLTQVYQEYVTDQKKTLKDNHNWDQYKDGLCKIPFYRSHELVMKSGVHYNILGDHKGPLSLFKETKDKNDSITEEIGIPDVLVSNKELRVQDIDDERLFIIGTVLHLADIANPSRPLSIAMEWGQRIRDEFFAQGDEERDLGLTVKTPMDRHSGVSIAATEVGFVENVLLPFYECMVNELLQDCQNPLQILKQNLKHWKKQVQKETPKKS